MPSFLANVHASMYRDGAPQALTPEQEASKREMYEKLTPEKKNVFWKAFVGSIEVSRERVITLTFHTTKVLAERMAKYDAGILSAL